MEKLINITAPQYRCSIGGCPAVYKSEDGKTFTIIGAIVGASQIGETKVGFSEEAVEISAELVLSSLGLPDLIEAAENVKGAFDTPVMRRRFEGNEFALQALASLREALSSIKGGK